MSHFGITSEETNQPIWHRNVRATSPVPTLESDRDFRLNTVEFEPHSEDHESLHSPTSSSIPFVVTRPSVSDSINSCHCPPECRQPCCVARMSALVPSTKSGFPNDQTGLLNPKRSSSPSVSSYGSIEVNNHSRPPLRGQDGGSHSSTPSIDDESQPLLSNYMEMRCNSPSGGPSFVVREQCGGAAGGGGQSRLDARCGCHVKVEDPTTRKAKIKLITALVIAFFFMLGEVLGGYFSGSLAIMTDAAHMLSDFAGFLISLFAIWLGSQPSSRGMSFGWHRAEVVGAVISVLIIWVITGVLFYEAVLRILNPDSYHVNPDVMLITACCGVFVNVFMCMVLHQHSHGHSHGGGGHSHGGRRRRNQRRSNNEEQGKEHQEQGRRNGRRRRRRSDEQNINVRAAFIHVIGDLIQSIGVVIAGYIIWFRRDWKIADPICTFLFCILVLISTLNVMKDALRVLMEGTPKHLNYEEVKEDLKQIPGVKNAHSLHIWSLTMNRTALAAHLALEHNANSQDVLVRASNMLREEYNITQTTLQVEEYQERMNECNTCQEEDKRGFFSVLCCKRLP